VISLHHFNTVEECIVENKKRENMFPYFLEKPCDTWLHLDVSAVMERKLVNVLALLQGLAIQAPCFHSTHSTHLRVTSWGVSVTDVTWTLVSFAAVFWMSRNGGTLRRVTSITRTWALSDYRQSFSGLIQLANQSPSRQANFCLHFRLVGHKIELEKPSCDTQ